ncbi:hypothetical protein GLOTRDRAFT_94129 [Gloeophyllum trabeum ATCC 11539]|uniref:Uncharacterized protein n=1 Tax=Gloeophyllum trabeum (strain ATCC 11539 / FP-39264 / Madison 617) TaxID=670483 RepID=S7Q3W9_GLOTA|nr:uncharacterized protein GLOTRDRAFT_94129 [Gloeophyllum trabeum ATCC 11539]EPQ54696.1 hypothetical protein GLOTRDRAFT_94129 [Gloeophyllum trabeum ATCC 11539]
MPSFFKALKALQARFTTSTTQPETASCPSTESPHPALSNTPTLIHRLSHKKEPSVSVSSSLGPVILADSPASAVTASSLEKLVTVSSSKSAVHKSADRVKLSSFIVPRPCVPLVPVTQCVAVGTLPEKPECMKVSIAEKIMEKTVSPVKEPASTKVRKETRQAGEDDPFAQADEEVRALEAVVDEGKASHEEWSLKMRELSSQPLDAFEDDEDRVTSHVDAARTAWKVVQERSCSPAGCSDYSMDATEVSFSSTVTVCVSPIPVLKCYGEEGKPLWDQGQGVWLTPPATT